MAGEYSKHNYERLKPKGFEDYLTRAEVAALIQRHPTRLTQLERQGHLPAPIRVKVGRLRVRLYSPKDVLRIQTYFANAKPGRPRRLSQ